MVSIFFGLIILLGQTIGIDIREGEALPPSFISPVSETESTEDAINSIYKDKTFFLSAIKQNPREQNVKGVTGITVPHHLLAKDLIAAIFAQISENEYETIIIICPDHFNGGKTPFSTTSKNFKTVFGTLKTDKKTVQTILSNPLIKESNLFNREHGMHAVTPFIKYHFPNVKIIPVAIRINSNQEELDTLAKTLTEAIKTSNPAALNKTLIIQSTDFSHYLTEPESNKKDQQTIQALNSNDPDQILLLNQPDNIDSIGSQYIQLKLQKEYFNSTLQIIHNLNSQKYTDEHVEETTSYITQIYSN